MRCTKSPRRLAATITGLALLATAAMAQPESVSLGSKVDELVVDRSRSDAPGGVVAVIKDGRIVHRTAFGMADLERGVSVTPNSVFEIGSISKQFTAMCVFLLELDGKLTLDDDVRKHLPELREYERPITIRHLLHHTSGIRDIETLIPLAGWHWFNYYSPARQLELITRQRRLNFAPGVQYLYSNSGYLILAEIIERVSGRSLRQFAEGRIFGPLDMKHTVFWDQPSQIVDNRAIAYSPDGKGGYGIELWNLPFAGPAGVYTTVGDLALWDANFYDNQLGGGAQLIERMETPGKLVNGESIEYAAGLVVGTYREQRLVTHGGAWMGYRASLARFPEQRLTIVTLSNGASGVGAMRIADVYLAAELDSQGSNGEATAAEVPETVALEVAELAPYEGVFWNESDSLLRKIEVRDEELMYVRGADSATPLGSLEAGHFIMIGPSVRVDVEFDDDGSDGGRTMKVSVEGQDPLVFEHIEPPSRVALKDLAGDYWSDELDRELRLRLVGGLIEASWADEPDSATAEPIAEDVLLLQAFVPVPWYRQDVRLRFERDEGGAVSGLTLTCDMVRGVAFDRL